MRAFLAGALRRSLTPIARGRYRGRVHRLRALFSPDGTRAGNRLDFDAYRCVGAAARNRQNQLRPSSPLRPVVTRRVREENAAKVSRFLVGEASIFLRASVGWLLCAASQIPIPIVSRLIETIADIHTISANSTACTRPKIFSKRILSPPAMRVAM